MSEETVPTANLEQAPAPEDAAPASAPSPSPSWKERLDQVLEQNSHRSPPVEEQPSEEEDSSEESGSLSWDDAIAAATPEQAKLMKQLRAESTRRFQEAAEMKRQAQADRDALFSSETFKHLQSMASSEADVDLFDPKSVDAFIDRKVAQRLQEVLKPVQQAHQTSVAQQRYTEFLTANPELKTDTALREQVASELRANANLSLEQAFYIVQGRGAQAKAKASASRRAAERRAAKAAALQVSAAPSRASGVSAPDLAGKSGADIYAALMRLQQTAE